MFTNPDRFASWFNSMVPGAYRQIAVDDVRDMTECGLIGKYRWYHHSDLETVRAVLQYEQLRGKRIEKSETKVVGHVPTCKRCGQPLSAPSQDKKGRHKEYCSGCESSRSTERSRRWRRKRVAVMGKVRLGLA